MFFLDFDIFSGTIMRIAITRNEQFSQNLTVALTRNEQLSQIFIFAITRKEKKMIFQESNLDDEPSRERARCEARLGHFHIQMGVSYNFTQGASYSRLASMFLKFGR